MREGRHVLLYSPSVLTALGWCGRLLIRHNKMPADVSYADDRYDQCDLSYSPFPFHPLSIPIPSLIHSHPYLGNSHFHFHFHLVFPFLIPIFDHVCSHFHPNKIPCVVIHVPRLYYGTQFSPLAYGGKYTTMYSHVTTQSPCGSLL